MFLKHLSSNTCTLSVTSFAFVTKTLPGMPDEL